MKEDNIKHQVRLVKDTDEETVNKFEKTKSILKNQYRKYQDWISKMDEYDMIDLWR